jgi:hypothetical protein
MESRKKKKRKSAAKLLPMVLAASVSTEAILSQHHNEAMAPNAERAVKPSKIVVKAKASAPTISSHDALLPDQPHIDPAGGVPVTDFALDQIS